jgi:hypothetical protein
LAAAVQALFYLSLTQSFRVSHNRFTHIHAPFVQQC